MDQIFDPKLHSPGGRDELTQQKQENLPQNGGGCRQLSTEEVLSSQQTSNITRSSCRGCHDSFQVVTSCGLGATNNPTSSKTVLRHTFRPSGELPSRRHIRRRRRRRPPPWPVRRRPTVTSFFTTLAFTTTVILLSSLATFTSAMKNEFLPIRDLCTRNSHNFRQQVPRHVDGAVIVSKNERDLDCTITFQTESILEKFLVRFDELGIDCNDRLEVFDGAHTHGRPVANISCEATPRGVGSIWTKTNYLTLKYVTDAWGTSRYGFRMIVTAYKKGSPTGECPDGRFVCGGRGSEVTCIHNDLVCDTVNHCHDGGDERSSQFCAPLNLPKWLVIDGDIATAVGIAIAFLILSCGTALWLRSCMHHQRRAARAAAGGTTESGHPGFRMLVPVRKPLTSLQNGTPTVAGMTSAGTYHQTTVGGGGMKPTVVTQAKSGSKAGVTTVTTTGLTASGNATRPAVRLGTTTFSNSGFKTATTNNHHLMQQPVITETDSRLRRKLISIFCHRR